MLKVSIGTTGKSTTSVVPTKNDTTNIVNLADARVPKYNASVLFFEVIAYSLGRDRISWSSGTGEHNVPQRNEDVGEE